jgi:hypothetical protein
VAPDMNDGGARTNEQEQIQPGIRGAIELRRGEPKQLQARSDAAAYRAMIDRGTAMLSEAFAEPSKRKGRRRSPPLTG